MCPLCIPAQKVKSVAKFLICPVHILRCSQSSQTSRGAVAYVQSRFLQWKSRDHLVLRVPTRSLVVMLIVSGLICRICSSLAVTDLGVTRDKPTRLCCTSPCLITLEKNFVCPTSREKLIARYESLTVNSGQCRTPGTRRMLTKYLLPSPSLFPACTSLGGGGTVWWCPKSP